MKGVKSVTRTLFCLSFCVFFLLAGCTKSENSSINSDQVSNGITNVVRSSDISESKISKTQAEEIAMNAVQAHNNEIGLDISKVYEIQKSELYEKNTILIPVLLEKNKTVIWIINVVPKPGLAPLPNSELEHYHDYGVFINAETGELLDLIWCA